MHRRRRVVHPGKDDNLFEERRCYGYISDRVHVGVEQDGCPELVGQGIGQETVEHVIVLCVSRRCVDIRRCVCPGVLQGHLPVVGEEVSRRTIVDWHRDEAMPIKTTSPVAHAGQEHGQVVRLPIKLFFEGCDGLVVEFRGGGPGIGVIVVEDGM